MYCPKCGQPQASDDMRYCSRCGFPLNTIAILLQNDGVLPSPPRARYRKLSRARIALESVILTLFTWALAVKTAFFFNVGGPLEVIARIASVIFFVMGLIGILRFLYAFLFVRESEERDEESFHQSPLTERNRCALPSPQQTPLSDFPRRSTKEMVRPISVTENTTRTLEEPSSGHNLEEY